MAATPPAEHRGLILGVAAPWLRRTVGPIAWSVLEALAEHAEPDSDRTVSYRSYASWRPSYASPTTRWPARSAGSPTPGCSATSPTGIPSGRFGSGHYVLNLPPNVFDDAIAPREPSPTDVVARRRASHRTGEQLALLPET